MLLLVLFAFFSTNSGAYTTPSGWERKAASTFLYTCVDALDILMLMQLTRNYEYPVPYHIGKLWYCGIIMQKLYHPYYHNQPKNTPPVLIYMLYVSLHGFMVLSTYQIPSPKKWYISVTVIFGMGLPQKIMDTTIVVFWG